MHVRKDFRILEPKTCKQNRRENKQTNKTQKSQGKGGYRISKVQNYKTFTFKTKFKHSWTKTKPRTLGKPKIDATRKLLNHQNHTQNKNAKCTTLVESPGISQTTTNINRLFQFVDW